MNDLVSLRSLSLIEPESFRVISIQKMRCMFRVAVVELAKNVVVHE